MFFPLLHEAWISIGASRMRAFLAMLGIVIGVSSVVLMIAVGNGSSEAVERSVSSLGSNLLIITPGNLITKPGHNATPPRIDVKDADALLNLPNVLLAAPVTYPRMMSLGSGGNSASANMTATTASFFEIGNWEFAAGAPFTPEDVQRANRVIVIGATLAKRLFPEQEQMPEEILGRTVVIGQTPLAIIGVLNAKGADLYGTDQDNSAFVPITTGPNRLWAVTDPAKIVDMIYAQAASSEDMEGAKEDILDMLRQIHKIREGDGDGFTINDLAAIAKTAIETTQSFSLLLGAIASISLVVGGIGIMNIMLVTVTERTREIGIRKAIGATSSHIMLQFLFEAIIISCVGSIIGLLIGVGGGFAAQSWFGIAVVYSMWSAILALAVAVVIGLCSGLYPAYKAAKLQPIEALRNIGG